MHRNNASNATDIFQSPSQLHLHERYQEIFDIAIMQHDYLIFINLADIFIQSNLTANKKSFTFREAAFIRSKDVSETKVLQHKHFSTFLTIRNVFEH